MRAAQHVAQSPRARAIRDVAVWALSTSTIWIDKTGIDQSSPEKTAAGVAAFPRILASCDKFVGLISPGYFRRLWCVYELATFTHMHGMHQVR